MTETRIRVESKPESRRNLPAAFKDAGKLIIEKQDMIAAVLSRSPMVGAEQFLVAAMAEVNSLEMSSRVKVDPTSVVKAVFNCATLGLLFGPTRGHAYLLPFQKKNSAVKIVNLVIGYKGYIELAYRSSFLKDVDTEVILEGETFKHRMTEQGRKIRHDLPVGRAGAKDGRNVIGAYCLYHTRQGGYGMANVSRAEIEAVRKDSEPWNFNYPAMARKTAVRRAAKNWSLTEQLAGAIYLDEHAERDEEQPLLTSCSQSADIKDVLRIEDKLPPSLLPGDSVAESEPDGDLMEYFAAESDTVYSDQWLSLLCESYGVIPIADFTQIVVERLSMTDPRGAVIKSILGATTKAYLSDAVSDTESLRQGGLLGSALYASMRRFAELRSRESF